MARRSRKPPVRPETRRAWLKRYEEDGESPPQIATADNFDVRTVRKQITLAREERERREARSAVLRNAVESHYRDICRFAEDLDTEIAKDSTVTSTHNTSPLWSALKQHLPRSPLWTKLERWDQALDELSVLKNDTRQHLTEVLQAEPRLTEILTAGEEGVIPGMVFALSFQMTSWAREWQGLDIDQNFRVEPTREGFVTINYGSAHMGEVKEEHADIIRETLVDFESTVIAWKEYEDMEKLFAEIKRLKAILHEELTIITLRRIVPGKCKYCPL